MGHTTSNWSLLALISIASCLVGVLSKSEARYGSYSGYRSKYNTGYFTRYGSNYHNTVPTPLQNHKPHHYRKYGYKIVSPPYQQQSQRFIASPDPVITNPEPIQQIIQTSPLNSEHIPSQKQVPSPQFSVDIDFSSPQKDFPSPISENSVAQVVEVKSAPVKPLPAFPKRISISAPLTISEPAPQKASPAPVPAPIPTPPKPSPEPAPIFKDVSSVPVLPQAVPAVPGRPVLSEVGTPVSSRPASSSLQTDLSILDLRANSKNTFIPMPVPAVPGL